MNAAPAPLVEARLQHLERQNRILLALLCAATGLALVAATKSAGNVVAADEVRTHRLFLTDASDRVVHGWTVHGAWIIEK